MTSQPTEIEATDHAAALPTVPARLDVLPTTVFERFVLNSEDHSHRMAMRVVLRLTGQVHSSELQTSWNEAVRRHPLLMSRVDPDGSAREWLPTDPPALELTTHQHAIDAIDVGDIEPMELSQRGGFRGHAHIGSDGLLITLDLHHACADATGMRQLISDWMHLYDCRVRDLPSQLQPYDNERLPARGEWTPPAGETVDTVGPVEGIRNFLLTVRGRTVRLNLRPVRQTKSAAGHNRLRTHCVQLKIESSDILTDDPAPDLRRSLKRFDVTLNDLLLACCMKSVDSYAGSRRPADRITVLNPVDLRRPSDRYLSACNRFGVVFLRRQRSACRDSLSLLRGLHDEMSYIKSKNVAVEFLKGLQQLEKIPVVSSLMRRLGWFVPTLQLTCLGDITRVPGRLFRSDGDGWVLTGNLRFESATGLPPIPPGAALAVAACLTGTRLTLGVRTTADAFSASATQEFAQELGSHVADLFRQLAEDRANRHTLGSVK